MKIKFILASLACAAVVMSSCSDEMDYSESNTYNKEYVFTNFGNTVGFVTNIYGWLDSDLGLFDSGMLASACDEAEHAWRTSTIQDFTNGAWTPSNSKANWWTESYSAIRASNFYLNECGNADFSELKYNKDYQAQMKRFERLQYEVRFLRAYFYFRLARQFGDVPLSTTVETESGVNKLPKTPAQDVFKFVCDECDAIVDKLPASYSNLGDDAASGEVGRVTSTAVLALKARTKLYAASPLFNTGNDVSKWREAAEASKAVIDACAANGITMTDDYSKLWGKTNWQNSEMIFTRGIGNVSWPESNNYPMGVQGGQSGNCPSQNLVEAYDLKDGSTVNWSDPAAAVAKFDDFDPRFSKTIAKNGDTGWPTFYGKALETYYGGANGEPLPNATPTSYYLKKYLDASVNTSSTNGTTATHAWITYRLGEFYLNYAEAVYKWLGSETATPGFTSGYNASALDAMNVTRTRAGVAALTEAQASERGFWNCYEKERMVELAFEGHRFWDLRRWKEGDKLKSITEMHITKNGTGDDATYTYTRKVVSRVWDDKMYLFPIPLSETLKNKNLTQNPGWSTSSTK